METKKSIITKIIKKSSNILRALQFALLMCGGIFIAMIGLVLCIESLLAIFLVLFGISAVVSAIEIESNMTKKLTKKNENGS
jgi:hypothetical protein